MITVFRDGSRVLLRNSQQPAGPVLRFEADEWDAFLAAIATGRVVPDTWATRSGDVLIFEPAGRGGLPVQVTRAEWAAFRDGAIAGDVARERVSA